VRYRLLTSTIVKIVIIDITNNLSIVLRAYGGELRGVIEAETYMEWVIEAGERDNTVKSWCMRVIANFM
jgi:hypothetical protein